ncbi:MAG: hypothetical protein E7521_00445 [Ruminococcaceae bacterium]|nr:hypothetical protein [Oscillospiraceae bacterium]
MLLYQKILLFTILIIKVYCAKIQVKVGGIVDISKIDKNFKVESKIEREGLTFYDIDETPFKIYGVFREGEHYVRMPTDTAKSVSERVVSLYRHSAGGRVRFVTNSPYVAVSIKLDRVYKMSHFAFTGSIGCDVYSGTRYIGTVVPPTNVTNEYEGVIDVPFNDEREYTINMPLYSETDKMYIGIKEGSILKAAPDYEIKKPIVYYGSSITQGGCASRPGNAYQSIISRELNADFINLGFSGSALAEDEMAEYIANLDMSAFVYDYDHNAPNLEHYKNTHEKFFKTIRKTQPDLPILMMTRPEYYLDEDESARLQVMLNTYNNAIAAGDKNVYYIKGPDLIESVREFALVDGGHPNDSGFVSMARVVGSKLKEIFK